MPYKRIGLKIYHYKNRKWSVKQTATTINKAKATMRILKSLESKEK